MGCWCDGGLLKWWIFRTSVYTVADPDSSASPWAMPRNAASCPRTNCGDLMTSLQLLWVHWNGCHSRAAPHVFHVFFKEVTMACFFYFGEKIWKGRKLLRGPELKQKGERPTSSRECKQASKQARGVGEGRWVRGGPQGRTQEWLGSHSVKTTRTLTGCVGAVDVRLPPRAVLPRETVLPPQICYCIYKYVGRVRTVKSRLDSFAPPCRKGTFYLHHGSGRPGV